MYVAEQEKYHGKSANDGLMIMAEFFHEATILDGQDNWPGLRVFAHHGFISLRYAISLICSILSGATSKLLVSPFSIDCIISISIISSDSDF